MRRSLYVSGRRRPTDNVRTASGLLQTAFSRTDLYSVLRYFIAPTHRTDVTDFLTPDPKGGCRITTAAGPKLTPNPRRNTVWSSVFAAHCINAITIRKLLTCCVENPNSKPKPNPIPDAYPNSDLSHDRNPNFNSTFGSIHEVSCKKRGEPPYF